MAHLPTGTVTFLFTDIEGSTKLVNELGDEYAGLRLLFVTEMYWVTNDPLGGRGRLEALLAAESADIDPSLQARALRFRGATYDLARWSRRGTGSRGRRRSSRSVSMRRISKACAARISNVVERAG